MECVHAIKEVQSLVGLKRRQRVILTERRWEAFREVATFEVGNDFERGRSSGEDFP